MHCVSETEYCARCSKHRADQLPLQSAPVLGNGPDMVKVDGIASQKNSRYKGPTLFLGEWRGWSCVI